jgi:hypothetical protein
MIPAKRDQSWPIYLLIAGIATILLRFINTGEGAMANGLQMILGSGLIAYALFMLLWRRRVS